MFIGNFMAQYELFIRCMHFNTIRNKLTFNLEHDKSKNFVNFFNTKLSFYLFYYDITWSATHVHVCKFYFLSASSIIWLLNYFPQFPCFCSSVPYYSSGFEIKVCHSNWAIVIALDFIIRIFIFDNVTIIQDEINLTQLFDNCPILPIMLPVISIATMITGNQANTNW